MMMKAMRPIRMRPGEGDSGDDEKENSVHGFEFAFAAGALIAAARLIRARLA